MGDIDSAVTAKYRSFLTRAKEVVNPWHLACPQSESENRFTVVQLVMEVRRRSRRYASHCYLLLGTWRPALDPAGRRLPTLAPRVAMRKSLSLFWLLFAAAIILGTSFLWMGLAGAQVIDFDPEEHVADDAPEFDPFVVYEWAASGSTCGLSAELLGAVGSAASDHGLLEGHIYAADGTLEPGLYGESGDGSRANLATLIDTDFGAIDDDDLWDRPVGPFQLLPVSWRLYGGDANRDGVEDPQNLWDASAAAAEFLCQMGAGRAGNDIAALRAYTGSDRLTQRVLGRYNNLLADSPVPKFVGRTESSKADSTGVSEVAAGSETAAEDVFLGDWDGNGTPTEFVWETAGNSLMFTSPIAVAIPLDENGRPYGAQVRVESSPGAEALVGDWNHDGFDSIAIRSALSDNTDVVEFYDRFGNASEDVVVIDSGAGVEDIWEQLEPEPTEFTGPVFDQSLTAANAQDIEVVWVEGILVNIEIADALEQMLEDAREDGVELDGWGWRSNERQIELRIQNCEDPWETPSSECSPPTARPGHSRHELGLAIDFHIEGRVITRPDPAFVWLEQHAGTYGLFNLPSEPWHWSVDGR